MALTKNDIEQITLLFRESGWNEMHLTVDGATLSLSTNSDGLDGVLDISSKPTPASDSAKRATTPAPAPTPAPTPVPTSRPVDGLLVRAPNLGTFWRRPGPGTPPYIEIGQAIDEDTDVCLIEVMKLFTPIKSGCKGRVVEVLVEDGEMVEFDQPLFRLEPLD